MATPLLNVKNHVLKQAQHYMDKGKDGYRITSDFSSNRKHPVTQRPQPHWGVDMTGSYGWNALDYIIAYDDGEIVALERNVKLTAVSGADKDWRVAEIQRLGQSSGNYVRIKHNEDYETRYIHMQYASIPTNLKVGTKVKKSEVIGYMGTTGMSTGGHLHFEVIKNGICVDPKPYLLSEKTIKGVDELKLLVDLSDKDKSSEYVRQYQRVLIERFGYKLVGGADGNFGNSTKQATEDYQKKNGLIITGKLDKATRNHINGDTQNTDQIIALQGEIVALTHKLGLRDSEIASLKAELDVLKASGKVVKEELDKAQDKLVAIKNAIEIIKSL